MDSSTIIQAKDLLKTEGIFKAKPDDSLSSALTTLSRTHDAIFVFDEDKYLGVINPYFTVFKSNFPPETKLQHCLFRPPQVALTTYVWDIAKLMAESKIYYLPVFDKSKFVGIVTINRLLSAIRKLGIDKKLSFEMKKKIITVDRDSTLEEAYTRMRDSQISRLPVVDTHQHLVGMVTRFDLREILATPKERPGMMSGIDEKRNHFEKPLEGHYKKLVYTVPAGANATQIIDILHSNNVGSVVVIDGQRQPIGLVSTADVLHAIDHIRPVTEHDLELTLPPDFIHETELIELLNRYVNKIEKSYPVSSIHAVMKTDKNSAGKIKLYEFSTRVTFKNKHQTVMAQSSGHAWKTVVREVLQKIRSQLYD